MSISTINPATRKTEKVYAAMTKDEISTKIARAQKAYMEWKVISYKERAKLMEKVTSNLRENKIKYAELMTREMGKPIKQAVGEVEKCAWVCEYFAENTEELLSTESVKTENKKSYVRFDPMGIILAVMPWNFPFWQVFRAAAPALMAGNGMVLKHASNVPQCAAVIEDIFKKSGFPKGLFTTLLIEGAATSQIVEDERIVAITLTGSEEAGIRVAEIAGRNLKKVVLELGGSDPFIVLEDANLKESALMACQARTQNSGQSCIAAKRFIVVKKVAEEFTKRFTDHMSSLIVGDPMDEATNIGPLARKEFVDILHKQVQKSIELGAKVTTGGEIITGTGYYYKPTVLTRVKKGMPAYDEELFGPVASIIVVNDEEEALKVANDTRFGLGASIWTKNIEKAEDMAVQIHSGAVFVNDFVKSDPRMPFGGVKKSGYGRELGEYGIKEFVNIKSIMVK